MELLLEYKNVSSHGKATQPEDGAGFASIKLDVELGWYQSCTF
jgi:hypothetical protein